MPMICNLLEEVDRFVGGQWFARLLRTWLLDSFI
jgi:hypothetical protein